MTDALLQNCRVLIVEDEFMIAEAVSRGLRRAGATIIGPVSNLPAALALVEESDSIDAAVLDINLGDQKVYPVVDLLQTRGVPCVFATGNDVADVPAAYASLIRCEKPVNTRCLIEALEQETGGERSDVVPADQALPPSMTDTLIQLIQTAEAKGRTLLVAKLCEALDVIDEQSQ